MVKRVVIEDIREERDNNLMEPGEIMEFINEKCNENNMILYAHIQEEEERGFSETQAIKHFDELLTAAQEVCNAAIEGSVDDDCLIHEDHIHRLQAIIRKISDEVIAQGKTMPCPKCAGASACFSGKDCDRCENSGVVPDTRRSSDEVAESNKQGRS